MKLRRTTINKTRNKPNANKKKQKLNILAEWKFSSIGSCFFNLHDFKRRQFPYKYIRFSYKRLPFCTCNDWHAYSAWEQHICIENKIVFVFSFDCFFFVSISVFGTVFFICGSSAQMHKKALNLTSIGNWE